MLVVHVRAEVLAEHEWNHAAVLLPTLFRHDVEPAGEGFEVRRGRLLDRQEFLELVEF